MIFITATETQLRRSLAEEHQTFSWQLQVSFFTTLKPLQPPSDFVGIPRDFRKASTAPTPGHRSCYSGLRISWRSSMSLQPVRDAVSDPTSALLGETLHLHKTSSLEVHVSLYQETHCQQRTFLNTQGLTAQFIPAKDNQVSEPHNRHFQAWLPGSSWVSPLSQILATCGGCYLLSQARMSTVLESPVRCQSHKPHIQNALASQFSMRGEKKLL